MQDADRFDPVDFYTLELKEKAKEKAKDLFDRKLEESKADEEANEQSYRKLVSMRENHKALTAQENSFRAWKNFCIVLAVLGFIAAVVGIIMLVAEFTTWISVLILVLGIALAVIMLVVVNVYFKPRLKKMEAQGQERTQEIALQSRECRDQVYPVSSRIRWDDIYTVFDETTDMFKLDKILDSKKYGLLEDLYGYDDLAFDSGSSVLGVMSGNIATNPFIKVKILTQYMYQKAYTGSITISWTETYTDSEGHIQTRVETQVLTATTYHPAPGYSDRVYTIYGNEAAPDLRFSRSARNVDYSDKKAVDKFVKSEEKKMRSKQDAEMTQGKGFTPLHNTRFEALWGAYERNNEVQYRLLFTPLAQQNMVEVLNNKNGDGYGDDFNFYKTGKINVVCSNHAQYGQMLFDPSYFRYSERIKDLRDRFVGCITEMFRSLYFDLAPVLAIPLYQMTDAGEYTYTRRDPDSISDYEAMEMANQFSEDAFKPEGAATQQIRRVVYRGTTGKTDSFKVISRAFSETPAVEYVEQMGGDGHLHTIPIQYFIYDPVETEGNMSVRRMGKSTEREDYENKVFDTCEDAPYKGHKSLLGLLVDCYNDKDEKRFSEAFDEGDEKGAERS